MPYVVNGQPITEDQVREEERRIGRDPRWMTIPDEGTRAARLRAAAERSAIARTRVEQAAASDPRPVDPNLIEQEVRRAKTASGLRGGLAQSAVRRRADPRRRRQRTTAAM